MESVLGGSLLLENKCVGSRFTLWQSADNLAMEKRGMPSGLYVYQHLIGGIWEDDKVIFMIREE